LHAGKTGYLPKYMTKENKHGVANRILILQAILVSFICLAFLLMPSVNGSYWLLTDLSTQLYMLMYVLLFFAAIALFAKHKIKSGFKIPGGKMGTWLVSGLGLTGCVITLVVGFFPPSTINVGGVAHYETVFVLGMVVMLLPVVGFLIYRAMNKNFLQAPF